MIELFGTLVVRGGVHVQAGQLVVIYSPVECADYARSIMRAAFEAGAGDCVIQWNDAMSGRIRYEMAPMEAFSEIPAWMTEARMHYARKGACFITIASEDPDILSGVDPAKLRAQSAAVNKAYAEYWEMITQNRCAWCVVSAPNRAWAKKLFPELSEDAAFAALEQAIARTMRLDTDNPLEALRINNARIAARAAVLNRLQLRTLHYHNRIGTDFSIDLPEHHIWQGGEEANQAGIYFTANLPTEEIFTAPDFRTANGRLVSAMPLCHQGRMVRNFSLTFEKGVLIAYDAEEGRDVLENIFSADEGARRLGEIALVEKASPISQMGLLFYNTLFDENASCHFAVGSAYPSCVEGGLDQSEVELLAMGINSSMEHVDFMVGTEDLQIIGVTADGREIPVFADGNFAIATVQ